MALYQGRKDTGFKSLITKNFMKRKVGTEVLYYKISLADTTTNVYGDATHKVYFKPVLITCTIDRNPQTSDNAEYGTSTDRLINFAFLRDDLVETNVIPEEGDIIVWNESYFEVNNVVEDQLLAGKDPNYALEAGLDKFGSSWSIICESHLAHISRLNILETE